MEDSQISDTQSSCLKVEGGGEGRLKRTLMSGSHETHGVHAIGDDTVIQAEACKFHNNGQARS